MFKRLKLQFKEPLIKKDLLKVLKTAFLYGLLYAVIFGLVFFFTEEINRFLGSFALDFITLFSIVIAHILSKKINENHGSGHIIYRLISVFAWLISYWIMCSVGKTFNLFVNTSFSGGSMSLREVGTFFNPLEAFKWIWNWDFLNNFQFFWFLNYILGLMLFIYAIFIMYRYSSRLL